MSSDPAAPPVVSPGFPLVMPYSAFNPLLETTYGVQLAGLYVSSALFGVFALQVFIYYHRRRHDIWPIRCLPAYLLIVEFLHQFLVCVAVYKVLVVQYGNQLFAISAIVPELFIGTMFQAFCATGAHLFYTYRIWRFAGKGHWISWVVPLITLPLSGLQLALTLTNCSLTLIHGSLAFLDTIAWTTYTTHGTNAFLDIFFVVAMMILLRKETSMFTKTTTMVNRLTLVVINTGLATTIFTLLTIIFLAAKPDTLIYVFFNFMISPLYGNSVLANLNSREYVRGANNGTSYSSGMQLATVKFNSNPSKTQVQSNETSKVEHVAVDVSTEVTHDYDTYGKKYAV